jgi:hypothetical protein
MTTYVELYLQQNQIYFLYVYQKNEFRLIIEERKLATIL